MIHMRFLLFPTVSAWVLCVIGARGFPARVTPSHFGLDSRGTDDRLSAPGLLFFQATRRRQNSFCAGSCCQVRNCVGDHFFWSYVIALQGYCDSSASYFMVLCRSGALYYNSSYHIAPRERGRGRDCSS